MKDENKTNAQPANELVILRKRVAELDTSERRKELRPLRGISLGSRGSCGAQDATVSDFPHYWRRILPRTGYLDMMPSSLLMFTPAHICLHSEAATPQYLVAASWLGPYVVPQKRPFPAWTIPTVSCLLYPLLRAFALSAWHRSCTNI
jgi:hypothetical protein